MAAAAVAFRSGVCAAAAARRGDTIRIGRAAGPITVDGDLSDPGWQGVTPIEKWYETNPGDNVAPKVRSVGYLAYDDRFFYAAFEFDDPEPARIRAPYGDRDNVSGYTDYGGVILDTRHDGKTGVLFLANPHGILYDALTSDATGNEDSSPDFFWDAATRIGPKGWTLELRIPFSSLRYSNADPQTWGILLYRNYPRDFRYQLFSAPLPRGENCFICHSSDLTGLTGLPSAGHLVAAPYGSAMEEGIPRGGPGTPLVNKPVRATGGLDAKWTPNADTAIDGTLNPDFSQVESDVAQISANERFALFYPEKRPFFLEGVDLLSTPVQAVYTRTITSPRWGLRATGKLESTAYTLLVAEDRGGGSMILPGPVSSGLADQDFGSIVAIGRLRHDFGSSFVSFLGTDREIKGGGSNRVFGPDFQWRPSASDSVTGQLLFSRSVTPDRPDLAGEWDGRTLSGHALDAWWSHSTSTLDFFTEIKDFGSGFRADDGFVPQVGTRENYGEAGWTFRPTGLVSRLRLFLIGDYTAGAEDALVFRELSPGFGLDAKWSTSVRIRLADDKVRAGDVPLARRQLVYTITTSPSKTIAQLSLDGRIGEEIDFANIRRGHGGRVTLGGTIRPTDHLELRWDSDLRWLNVVAPGGESRRLFTAQVERLKATYTFSARCFLRVIGQYVAVDQNPALYVDPVDEKSGSFAASVLFAFKLNWQSVLFVGYGDSRTLTSEDRFEKSDRQLFLKLSYAFQL